MTELYQRVLVKTPYRLARKFLSDWLSARAGTREPTTITLTLPAGRSAEGGIHREVLATYHRGSDPNHFDEPWRVHWTPKGGGPFPDFDGEITVRADENYVSSILELRGDYRPPGGIAGAAFDAMLGNRIASATARKLLTTIAREIEQTYHAQEEAKAQRASD